MKSDDLVPPTPRAYPVLDVANPSWTDLVDAESGRPVHEGWDVAPAGKRGAEPGSRT
jgi:hypothetical protein